MKKQVLSEQVKRYQRLVEISGDLASTLNLDPLLRKIINVSTELSGAETASILLYDDEKHQLYFQSATNVQDESTLRGMVIPENSIAGWVAINRKPAVVDNVHADTRFFDTVEKTLNFPTRSLAAIPMVAKDQLIGVLEVLNKYNGPFTEEDMQTLTALGAQAALAIVNSRLFQQSNLIAEFVHELRTPLTSIGALAYMLQRHGISDEQRMELSATIYQETQRLNELASSFLDLASLESGRVVFHPHATDVGELIEECCRIVEPKAQEQQIHILREISADLPVIEVDPDKMQRVILNLLTNAIKYNQANGKIWVKARVENTFLGISIQDTGLGIPADQLPFLFEKFFRANNVEKSVPGTGLGLSICKRIVEQQGGSISVQSQLQKGTTFNILIPIKRADD